MRISFVEKETTMTTAKNNFCYPVATAPGFKSAARFAARKKLLFLQVVSVVSKRTYRQERQHVRPGRDLFVEDDFREVASM